MGIPRDLETFVKQLTCRFCSTPSGRGLVVTISPEDGGYYLSTKCLRCGAFGHLRLQTQPEDPPTVGVGASDISSDEMIDLHQAMKAPDWFGALTGNHA